MAEIGACLDWVLSTLALELEAGEASDATYARLFRFILSLKSAKKQLCSLSSIQAIGQLQFKCLLSGWLQVDMKAAVAACLKLQVSCRLTSGLFRLKSSTSSGRLASTTRSGHDANSRLKHSTARAEPLANRQSLFSLGFS